MKRNILKLFFIISTLTALIILSSCGGEAVPEGAEITGAIFNSASFDYNGQEHVLTAENLPKGVTAKYENNKATDAGTYEAKVTLSGDGWKTKTMTATLTVNKIEISGITLESAVFDYDGTTHSINVNGELPSGVSVRYEGNDVKNAGTYSVNAILEGKNYISKTLSAEITVNKTDITGIALTEGESVKADGEFHFPTVSGNVPEGVDLKWYFNGEESAHGVKAIGTYEVKLILSGSNYNELTLNSTYKIKLDLSGLALSVIDSFGSTPDAWGFLPEAFGMDMLTVDTLPDYSSFIDVSSIPKNYIGKQMNVVFGVLNKCDTALGYVNTVHGALNVIEKAYQTFLNNSPDNYKEFSGDAGAFTYRIFLSDTLYSLSASIGSVEVLLYSDLENRSYGARIQLTDTTVLKYEILNNRLKIALNILNASSTQVEFIRDEEDPEAVIGYIYEYLTVAGKELVSTSALLNVGEYYTTVVGTKGDFIPTANARNCEVYNNLTGRLVGTEVSEVLGDNKKAYDTIWYNIFDIVGITSIKKEDKINVLNPDTVYINGKSDSIHTKIASLLPPDPSRRFDIEFKTVCAYKFDEDKGEYVLCEFEVPMIFIQETYEPEFESDFEAANSVTVTINQSSSNRNAVNYGYHVLVEVYNTVKDLVSQDDIKNYCSIK